MYLYTKLHIGSISLRVCYFNSIKRIPLKTHLQYTPTIRNYFVPTKKEEKTQCHFSNYIKQIEIILCIIYLY